MQPTIQSTTLSSKGQVVIPKNLRRRLHLSPGQRLEIHEQSGSLILRAADSGAFPLRSLDDLVGCAGYNGPAKSIEEMDSAISAMMKRG